MQSNREDIRLYCGVNETSWNHHSVTPGKYACVAPVYGRSLKTKQMNPVAVPADTKIIYDSGAFVDGLTPATHKANESRVRYLFKCNGRLTNEEALERQLMHIELKGLKHQVEALASYDLLIDEKWENGERSKVRWSRQEAEFAVKQTVNAAAYLDTQRKRLYEHFGRPMPLILSAQGVEVEQYLACAASVVRYMQKGDIFGLGGWCITGLRPYEIMPSFREIMQTVIPFLGRQGVEDVHVWGMIYPDALGELAYLCHRAGIKLRTDSSGPCFNPVRPSWGYGSWRNPDYTIPPILESCKVLDAQGNKAPTCEHGTFCRGLERIRHVELTRSYLNNFCDVEPSKYGSMPFVRPTHIQDSWLDLVREVA